MPPLSVATIAFLQLFAHLLVNSLVSKPGNQQYLRQQSPQSPRRLRDFLISKHLILAVDQTPSEIKMLIAVGNEHLKNDRKTFFP